MLREPGGLKEPVVHVWTHRGHRVLPPQTPEILQCDDGDAVVVRSFFPKDKLPADPTGKWTCGTYTMGGQLVGLRKFEVLTAKGEHVEPTDRGSEPTPKPTTPTPDAGVGAVTDGGTPRD
jgi:hypothetical protein